ncbi:MAG TPA: hypothetical protein VGM03_05240, partial [Phycisphaerae bacterium]
MPRSIRAISFKRTDVLADGLAELPLAASACPAGAPGRGGSAVMIYAWRLDEGRSLRRRRLRLDDDAFADVNRADEYAIRGQSQGEPQP